MLENESFISTNLSLEVDRKRNSEALKNHLLQAVVMMTNNQEEDNVKDIGCWSLLLEATHTDSLYNMCELLKKMINKIRTHGASYHEEHRQHLHHHHHSHLSDSSHLPYTNELTYPYSYNMTHNMNSQRPQQLPSQYLNSQQLPRHDSTSSEMMYSLCDTLYPTGLPLSLQPPQISGQPPHQFSSSTDAIDSPYVYSYHDVPNDPYYHIRSVMTHDVRGQKIAQSNELGAAGGGYFANEQDPVLQYSHQPSSFQWQHYQQSQQQRSRGSETATFCNNNNKINIENYHHQQPSDHGRDCSKQSSNTHDSSQDGISSLHSQSESPINLTIE